MTIQIQRGSVVEVQRGRPKRVPGSSLLDGMAVVWKHWQASFRKNRTTADGNFSDIHGVFTVEYPDEKTKLPEAYRNMPILLYDDATGHELCTSCFQCQRICPPQVIHMTQAKDPVTGKAVPAVAEFIIEYDACMSCGFCAEVCPFDAIKMDHEFELSTADHPSLTVHKAELNRPISYYESIAPTMWAEAQAGALKKLQGNIKRRPDVIGMAPQLTEKIAARRRELAEAAVAAPPAPVAAAPAAPAAPAEARKLTPEEKAAKLAAIRAKNAGQPAEPAEPAAPASGDPAQDKAARLAAIRAKNAAKQPAEGSAPVPTVEASAAPADDKAARLAAIRAKNAAKQAAEHGETAPTGEASAAPLDEKAARLAAIRAKNAAKQAAEHGEGGSNGESAPAVEPVAAPLDEKAARLAEIRAKNAAKKAAENSGE